MKIYQNFKRDVMVHWVIYTTSVMVFMLVALLLSSFRIAPTWVLGVSLTLGAVLQFGLHGLWFWSKLKRESEVSND